MLPQTALIQKSMIPWHKDVVQRVDLEAGHLRQWGVDY